MLNKEGAEEESIRILSSDIVNTPFNEITEYEPPSKID